MIRHWNDYCADCGKPLSPIQNAFTRPFDPVCGRCCGIRRAADPVLSAVDAVNAEGADDNLRSAILDAVDSLRALDRDPAQLRAVQAVCESAGVTW